MQEGDWAYEWQGNGMLKSVKRPDGEVVSFEYAPLGRRISKRYKGTTTRWVWDGNVPLHEWTDEEKREGAGDENLITWLFEEGSFVPCAKLQNGESYSIITDYPGTPTHAFNSNGAKVWERELDIYGKAREGDSSFIPFLFQGQYFDAETGLCYNRFRYYSPDTGSYISQDPIGLWGGLKLYGYVKDINSWIDILGLSGTGGAYMFGFASGDMYIGKGEVGRMNQSISTRSTQVSKMGGDNTLIGKAHISTGGNNDLGKMVEYKAMYDAGFEPGRGGVPDGYLNRHMSGKSTWDANPHLQDQATELAKKLRADYDADVKARRKSQTKSQR